MKKIIRNKENITKGSCGGNVEHPQYDVGKLTCLNLILSRSIEYHLLFIVWQEYHG